MTEQRTIGLKATWLGRGLRATAAPALLSLCIVMLAACSDEVTPRTDSETHWLASCETSSDCPSILSCVCGYCTSTCAVGATCEGTTSEGTCVAASPFVNQCEAVGQPLGTDEGTCLPDCRNNSDCAAVGAELVCDSGACIPAALAGVDPPGFDMGSGDVGDTGVPGCVGADCDAGSPDLRDVTVTDAPDTGTSDIPIQDVLLDGASDTASGDLADTTVPTDMRTVDVGEFEFCGGLQGRECPDTHYCEHLNDQCGGGDQFGVCVILPLGCPDHIEWACGCNGELYSNTCEAHDDGVDVSTFNLCEPQIGDFPCGPRFCDSDTEFCERQLRPGDNQPDINVCKPVPVACGDTPSCDCLTTENCGDMCDARGDGFRLTCESEADTRFTGVWVVDQPNHALYEATVYTLQGDGRLREMRTFTFDDPVLEGYATGTVGHCVEEDCRYCKFGSGWRSLDERHLGIEGLCSDAVAREIILEFPEDTSNDQIGVIPTIQEVGTETDWIHPDFDWRFFKCPSDEDCLDF